MLRTQWAAGAATLILTIASGLPAYAQPSCWHPYEVESAKVRDLQTMLMMGTLKCSSAGSALEASYNSFINKNRGTLAAHNNVLKAHFMRQSGISGGQSDYDAFTTGLANSHSARAQSANFCDMAETLVTLAEASNGDELMTMARNFSEKPEGVGEMCEVTVAAASLPMAMPATVTAETPATAAAAAAEPEAAATPAPQSAAAALEAAAIAMQAAAAALKEQQQAAQPAALKEQQQAAQPAANADPGKVSTDGLDVEVVKQAPVEPPATEW